MTETQQAKKDGESADRSNEYSQLASKKEVGLLREFGEFLLHNKKWWLAPIIVVLLLFGVMIAISSSAVAPFIYSFW